MIEINAETQEHATILLVDDNAINLQLLFETLDGQGYLLLAARSGEEALRCDESTHRILMCRY